MGGQQQGMTSQGARGDRRSGGVPTWTIVFEQRVVLVEPCVWATKHRRRGWSSMLLSTIEPITVLAFLTLSTDVEAKAPYLIRDAATPRFQGPKRGLGPSKGSRSSGEGVPSLPTCLLSSCKPD